MFQIVLSGLSLIILSACNNITPSDTDWARDCEKFSSLDSREEDQCKKRNPLPHASGVDIDPGDMDRVDEQNIGKGH